VIHVEEDFGYDADVHDGFKKTQEGCKHAATMNNRCHANGVKRNISDSRNNNQEKGNGYRNRHGAP